MGELPPRARRILVADAVIVLVCGTTSACAENTSEEAQADILIRNYLRVRGEYIPPPIRRGVYSELPPRARRILNLWDIWGHAIGTTSACAENTRQTPK